MDAWAVGRLPLKATLCGIATCPSGERHVSFGNLPKRHTRSQVILALLRSRRALGWTQVAAQVTGRTLKGRKVHYQEVPWDRAGVPGCQALRTG